MKFQFLLFTSAFNLLIAAVLLAIAASAPAASVIGVTAGVIA